MEVESGHLADVDWQEGILTIVFRDGSTYVYDDVPFGLYQELLAAPSKSLFFRESIKGQFSYQRVG